MRGAREVLGAALAAAVTLTFALSGTAAAQEPVREACAGASPLAPPCVALQKVADGVTFPLAPPAVAAARDAYLRSWVHRAAQRQYDLQDDVPFLRAQWVGTHNSFNSLAEGFTLSHADSNQQLTLAQQLDVDVRALELDVHYLPSVRAGGAKTPVVCHGRGPDEAHVGCTTEQPLTAVLPEVRDWLRAHDDQVVLLYLEDAVEDAAGYAATVRALEDGLRRADGSSMILHPDPATFGGKACGSLPLTLTRSAVRAAGAQVVLVGDCAGGWSSVVHGWNDVHVESGSTARYAAFPSCDASYPRSVYDAKLVRYYEDSTLVRVAVDPTIPANDPERLTPAKVAAMAGCGVGLFGFDQLLPQDGRLEATIWSWARDEPRAAAGACTAQRADGRWERRDCATRLRAACRVSGAWRLTTRAVAYRSAAAACRALDGRLAVPRDGYDNSLLHQAAGAAATWLRKV